ncbi:hypothetical protein [Rhodanobacter sp. MP1X3]|uniref:hypothetical protein n=1 Tax=Rhodanobacter sp. MP1X3 TaxID=2723086 RepID=UPI001617DFD5|nr:hypothetical protein [Rhodanobacter sp. MP1X3]MBB6243098.1 hypothetical protein [Rhodanobacter sp. MP1X3]
MDMLKGERILPVRVISVRLAATIFAFELGEWKGVEIAESELEPFLQPQTDSDQVRAGTSPHSWGQLTLKGAISRARDAIESLLVHSIDAGRMAVLEERRDLAGALVTGETLLDVDKVFDWAEVHGLEPGDFFTNYVEDETEIAMAALSRINDERARLENPVEHARVMKRVADMDSDYVIELMRENERFRQRAREREQPDTPLDGRQRTTLLAIIGALANAAKLDLTQHYKAGEAVAAMLDEQGVKLSGRSIGEHLKSVREAMNRRKV